MHSMCEETREHFMELVLSSTLTGPRDETHQAFAAGAIISSAPHAYILVHVNYAPLKLIKHTYNWTTFCYPPSLTLSLFWSLLNDVLGVWSSASYSQHRAWSNPVKYESHHVTL